MKTAITYLIVVLSAFVAYLELVPNSVGIAIQMQDQAQ